VFAFDFEMAKVAERLENARLAVEKSLEYNAPGAVDELAAPADLMTIRSIKVTMPVVTLAKVSF